MTSASATSAAATVVVVEPHADNRAMYQTFLELAGWDASLFENANAALVRLHCEPRPQAVAFDFLLPDMTAVAFCGAIDALLGDKNPSLRRIVVTGWLLSAADRDALTRGGVTAIYQKPCNLDVLLRALQP